MNKLNPKISEIRQMIDRYYDCSLSDAEERQLRLIIAQTRLSDPAIDEMRALMGFRRPPLRHALKARRFSPGRILAYSGVAAAVALLFTVGVVRLTAGHSSVDSRCIAYSNGRCITDEEEVLRLIVGDLQSFEESASIEVSGFTDELSDVAPIIEDYECNFSLSDL